MLILLQPCDIYATDTSTDPLHFEIDRNAVAFLEVRLNDAKTLPFLNHRQAMLQSTSQQLFIGVKLPLRFGLHSTLLWMIFYSTTTLPL